jgi:hypothetical protein
MNLYGLTPSYSTTDYSGFVVQSSDTTKTAGYGTITATRTFSVSGQNLIFQNTFSLGQNDSFVKIVNVMINNSTAPVQNAYIWVGTRDDYVGSSDVNTKTRGNLVGGAFRAIAANNQSSYAIMITNANEGVLFYSETPGVMTAYSSCCSFANAYNANPLTLPPMSPPTDGSYAAVLPLGTIGVNRSASITWYYAAGAVSSLGAVAQTVAEAQVADAGPLPVVEVPSMSGTGSGTPTLTPTGTPTSTPTATPTATTTVTATESVTPQPVPATSEAIYAIPEMVPVIYFIIPLTLLVISCAMLCCIGACYCKKKYHKKPETKDSETQTVAVHTDIVHIRTVEESGQTSS